MAVESNSLTGLGYARVGLPFSPQVLAITIALTLLYILSLADIGKVIGPVLAPFIMAWTSTAWLNLEVPLSLDGVLLHRNDITHFDTSRLG